MKRDVPEPWATVMKKRGLVDPRNGNPSMTKLAEASDTHASTIGAMMFGDRETSAEVIARVAAALYPNGGGNFSRRLREVNSWVGRALESAQPFQLHPDADLLTPKEREVVNDLVRLLAASKKGRPAAARPDLEVVQEAARRNPNRPPPMVDE